MKPIAWRHMAVWGATTGFMVGGTGMLLLLLITFTPDQVSMLGSPLVFFSALISMLIGTPIGILAGFIIEHLLPARTSDIRRRKLQDHLLRLAPIVFGLYATMFYVALGYGYKVYTAALPASLQAHLSNLPYVIHVPTVIAGLVAVYATYRYLLRLWHYYRPSHRSNNLAQRFQQHSHRPPQQRLTFNDLMASNPPQPNRSSHLHQRRQRRE